MRFKTAEGHYTSVSPITLDEGTDSAWVEILPQRKVQHPVYGEMDITQEKLDNMVSNFSMAIPQDELDLDYSHKRDNAKGDKAAGWIKATEQRPASNGDGNSLWGKVDFTSEGAAAVRNKEFRYISAEFTDRWTDPRTSHEYNDVLFGAALTNRPFMRGMAPVNLSDVMTEDEVKAETLRDLAEGFFEAHPEYKVELLSMFGEEDEDVKLTDEDIAFLMAAVDNSAWDGNAAMSACKNASDYASICAGRRAGDPNQRQTWALPHHSRPGAPPNVQGVRSALQMLPKTQGLTNKDAAQRHLEAHMRSVSPQKNEEVTEEVDRKKLCDILGLAENSTDEQIEAKLAEIKPAPEVEKPKTFEEMFPEKAAELAEEKRGRLLEAAMNTVKGWGEVGLPAKLFSEAEALLVGDEKYKFEDKDNKEVEEDAGFKHFMERLLSAGLVPVKKHTPPRTGEDDEAEQLEDPRDEIERRAKKLMEADDKLDYVAARRKVAADDEELAKKALVFGKSN